ncbi:hypothetical protein ACH4GM_32125 [Streptomyces coeruleorubidus]|uniref:hypothetical protein n=1 Tax=Streptomyces coeruleorubidus TaxID=116188 RepID=UPI00379FA2E1
MERLLKAEAGEGMPRPSSIRTEDAEQSSGRRQQGEEVQELAREQADMDKQRLSDTTKSVKTPAKFTDESSTWRHQVEEILELARKQSEQRHREWSELA